MKRTNWVAVLALAGAVGVGAACNDNPAADATREAGEAQADRLEEKADRTREAGDARADNAERATEAQADRLEQQADATRDATERRADAIEDQERPGTAADRTRDRMDQTAGTAGREADRAGDRVSASADAAKETADIKTALMAAEDIPSMSIDVDTNATTKTVTLSGTVRTAAQKAQAESIAKREAPDYKINNQLKVSAAR